jgi:hypothetical protein
MALKPTEPIERKNRATTWGPWLLLVIGLALTATGLGWQWLSPPSAYWPDEKAEAFAEATASAHSATIRGTPGELQTARTRYMVLRDELDAARHRRETWGRSLAIGGVLMAGTGAWLLRHSSDRG